MKTPLLSCCRSISNTSVIFLQPASPGIAGRRNLNFIPVPQKGFLSYCATSQRPGRSALITRAGLHHPSIRFVALDRRVPLVRLVRPRRPAGRRRRADLEHLIAQNHPLPIPRAERHSRFSVRLVFDDDGGLVTGREFFENFFARVCSHKSAWVVIAVECRFLTLHPSLSGVPLTDSQREIAETLFERMLRLPQVDNLVT